MTPPQIGDYASALTQSNQGWRQGILISTAQPFQLIDMSRTTFYCTSAGAFAFDHTTLPEPLRAWATDTRFDTIRRATPDTKELAARDLDSGYQLWLFGWGPAGEQTFTFEIRDDRRIIQSSGTHSQAAGKSREETLTAARADYDQLLAFFREDSDEDLNK